MRWLVRFILLFLVIALFLRWLVRLWASALRRRPVEFLQEKQGTMERDPLCGTYVARELSFPEPGESKTLYFCSERCRQEFRAGRRPLEAQSR